MMEAMPQVNRSAVMSLTRSCCGSLMALAIRIGTSTAPA